MASASSEWPSWFQILQVLVGQIEAMFLWLTMEMNWKLGPHFSFYIIIFSLEMIYPSGDSYTMVIVTAAFKKYF